MTEDSEPSDNMTARTTRALQRVVAGEPPSAPAVLRRLISCRKWPSGHQANQWSRDPIPVRLGPYPRPRPPSRHMEWRAVRATGGQHVFVVLCMVQVARSDFQAWLVIELSQGRAVIERWEYHGAHSIDGLHSHSWCATAGAPIGPQSIDAPVRLPGSRSRHRRCGITWSKEAFWIAACRHFAVQLSEIDQQEMAL